MADKTIAGWFASNPITLDPADVIPASENLATTPVTGGFKAAQLMFNRYRLNVTVSSNDLIVEVVHEDGTAIYTDRPLYFKIGDTIRAVTAPLSVTKADGTNWANLGSSELGTLEQDLFVYVTWNTNLSPDAVDIFWSRYPMGRRYSDFSSTTTNDKYAAINATAPASTDDCVCIGRFAATLSLTGTGHVWTVPTYTSINLIQHPIFNTRWLTWNPNEPGTSLIDGFSANPTNTIYQYQINGYEAIVYSRQGANGTSNDTIFVMRAPFAALTLTDGNWNVMAGAVVNSGTASATPGFVAIASGASVISVLRDALTTAWTNSGGKRIGTFRLVYPIGQ